MIDKTIAHYRILEKIGEGAMGVVYKAHDTKLNRAVALKFLSPALSCDTRAKQLFIHEAQATSALDHPNICTIHEIAETDDDQLYLVLTWYEGETLQQKLARGPLEAGEAARITRGVAQGLGRAHAEGIVHRDFKPANVFLTKDELVKILDFGIAKLIDRTGPGKVENLVGTASYMSPEQIRGDEVDRRTDIWALGVVLYEMITGNRPFRGLYQNAVFYSILHEEPPPIAAFIEDAPPWIVQIVTRCLQKDPVQRYQSMAAVEQELSGGRAGESTPSSTETSIAILPFVNMSSDPEQEFFCDGMAEEIINTLSRVPGLRVAARTSSFAFKGQHADVREIGLKLGVQSLLEGSVRKSGCRLRIAVQLIDVAGGYQVWAERFDRQVEDVFTVQEQIAHKVTEALQLTLEASARSAYSDRTTRDVKAYEYYLQARQYLYRQSRRSLEYARRLFLRATEVDPGYALAYAGVADSCCLTCMWYERSEDLLAMADTASRKALELAPEHAQPHASRGFALAFNRCFAEAEREFEIAVELDDRLFEVWYFYGRCQVLQGKLVEAVEYFKRANEVRPEDFQSLFLAAQVLRELGREEEAAAIGKRALEVAQRHLEFNPRDTRALYLGAATLVTLGEKERGLAQARRAVELNGDGTGMLYNLACIHCLAGEHQQAMDLLERWEREGAVHKEWLLNDPDLVDLRDMPRFRDLVDRLP